MKTKPTAIQNTKKPHIQKILTIPQCPRARDWFELIIYGNGLSGCRPILQGLSIGEGFPCSFLPFKSGEGPLQQKVIEVTSQSENRIKAMIDGLTWKGLYDVKVVDPNGRESNTIDIVIEEPREEKRPPVPLISPLPFRIGGGRIVKMIATIPTVGIFPQIQGFRKMEALPVGHTPFSITETPPQPGQREKKASETPAYQWEIKGQEVSCNGSRPIKLEDRMSKIFKYLHDRRGKPVKIQSLEKEVGLTREGIRDAMIDLKNLLSRGLGIDRNQMDKIIEAIKDRKNKNEITAYVFH